ncbi:MAG: hypothetical protein HN390_14555 [Anaerolineae bacterium]|nr:hypothetical protein [Anaerolineae bacterium]
MRAQSFVAGNGLGEAVQCITPSGRENPFKRHKAIDTHQLVKHGATYSRMPPTTTPGTISQPAAWTRAFASARVRSGRRFWRNVLVRAAI